MGYAAENLIPVTLELGGKSPNIFFEDVADADDAFFDKALEGFAMFALNQGEVCTCPSRALVQNSMAADFMPKAVARVEAVTQGDPLDTETMMGAQASREQFDKILSYIDIAPRSSPGARGPTSVATSAVASTSSRRSSRGITRCGSSRRRSSARSSR